MAKKTMKLNNGTKKEQEDHELKTMAVDRFSELPDTLIHLILSFLPTIDAVRMSLLSKRWRNIWYSLPVLDFDESTIAGGFNAKMFSKLVGKCLKLRKAGMLAANGEIAIAKFRLVTGSMYRWSRIHSWLGLVSESKIKELDLYIACRPRKSFFVPPNIIRIRSLTRLRLANVVVMNLDSNLPALISLSLENVKSSDQVLCDLVLRCCSLERLLVNSCRGLSKLKVSSSSLKFLEIASTECEVCQVEASNLESFVCSGRQTRLDGLSLSLCGALRNLSFTGSSFYAQWLEHQLLGLPFLDRLTLRDCNKVVWLRINIRHLKYLIFEGNGIDGIAEVLIIDSPNLVYFSYEGYLMSNSFINPGNNLLEAKIKCHYPGAYDKDWYENLIDFLRNLNCVNTMLLDVLSEEALIVPRKLRKRAGSPLPALKHLYIRTRMPYSGNCDLRNAIAWLSPSLETLSIE
ncbi:hypothetical protein TIFTF001_001886 [Ficus carica]|uniref:F-box domain-containing protein n=1 Tax=Ficus carica TaxID=3494 RepID=A0AA88CS32_FICCA|nr:hypothetical protein TIFTF001_001886 [Ficus carica]